MNLVPSDASSPSIWLIIIKCLLYNSGHAILHVTVNSLLTLLNVIRGINPKQH